MKGNILCLETSSGLCSVAISTSDEALIGQESSVPQSHSNLINLMIEEVLEEAGLKMSDLDAVAVSAGPGSYTGLRIGASVATGIAYGAQIPLIAILSLRCMFNGMVEKQTKLENSTLLCPMIDARRMEVYTAAYNLEGVEEMAPNAMIIDQNSFKEELDQRPICFFGSGADKVQSEVHHSNASFHCESFISARFLLPTAIERFRAKKFEDLAYWTPFYLKEHMTGAHRSRKLNL